MNYFQEQILQQKMVMTQEMMQSLEILQVSAVELKSIIEREHEENPLLEIVDNHETKDETKEVKENKVSTKTETNKESQKIRDLEERIEILEKYIITSENTGCKTDMKSKPEGFNSIMHREAIYNQMKKR